jgi:hypothetical protein
MTADAAGQVTLQEGAERFIGVQVNQPLGSGEAHRFFVVENQTRVLKVMFNLSFADQCAYGDNLT